VSPYERAFERAAGVYALARGVSGIAARNAPQRNIEGAFDIADAALRLGWAKVSLERLVSDPDVVALMRQRYGAGQRYSAARLGRSPAGSLGKLLFDSIGAGYDPDFYRRNEIASDWEWASHRGRQIHDVLHLVTGYPPTIVGEIGVFAFMAGNLLDYGSLLIAVTAVAGHLGLRPELLAVDASVFARAFLAGRKVRPVLGVKFEELFDRSIFEVREQLGIPRYGLGLVDGGERLAKFSFRELDVSPLRRTASLRRLERPVDAATLVA
jgi:ubiquinone biosynthesis protein Coq4